MRELFTKFVSFGLSLVVSSTLLLLMAFDREVEKIPVENFIKYNEVKLKPPVITKSLSKAVSQKNTLKLEVTSISNSPIDLTLELEPVETSFSLDLKKGEMQALDITFDRELKVDLAEDIQFSFDDLNYNPTLLHTGGFKFNFPRELSRRGLKEGVVTIRIEIDKKGKAKVLEVLSSTHALLVPLARDLVSRSRYTIPQKNGEAVSSTGVMPITFKAD